MPYSRRQLERLVDNDDPLISVEQAPHRAIRIAETELKRHLFALEDRAVIEINRLYRDAWRDLRNTGEMLLDGEPDVRWRRAIRPRVRQRLARLRDSVMAVSLRGALAAAAGGYYGSAWQVDVATIDAAPVRVPRIDPGAVVLGEAFSGDAYLTIIQSLLGREWGEQFAWLIDELDAELALTMVTAIENGETVQQVFQRVRAVMGLETNRRTGGRANFHKVQTITRTVINQTYNDATQQLYAANADIVAKKRWLTARDERVCKLCAPLDGTVSDVDDMSQSPPRHPSCRCTELPDLDENWLINASENPPSTLQEWAVSAGLAVIMADFLTSMRPSERV